MHWKIRVQKWPLPLLARKTQWQNLECIYAEILNKTSLAMMVTSEMPYIFSSCIIKSSIYAVFCFVWLRDRIFILCLLITWPEYLFLKSKFQILLRIKWPSPKRHICCPREGEVPFCVLGYRQAKNILNLTEHFQFRPCHFSFYHVLQYSLWITSEYLLIF